MDTEAVRTILDDHGKLSILSSDLDPDDNLFDIGLTSLTTVNLMLALEDHFDVEFEEEMLNRSTFESINAISESIEQLLNN